MNAIIIWILIAVLVGGACFFLAKLLLTLLFGD
jgi:hypothetical protein